MTDIPIQRAIIAWNRIPPAGNGAIKVVLWPDKTHLCDLFNLEHTYGACNAGWRSSKKQFLQMELMTLAWSIVLLYGLNICDVHQAFLVIPEYRDLTLGEIRNPQ